MTDLPVLGLEELFSLHVSPLPPERLPLFDVGLCVPLICLPDFTAKRKADMTGELMRTSESTINHSCLLSETGSQRVDNSIFDSYFAVELAYLGKIQESSFNTIINPYINPLRFNPLVNPLWFNPLVNPIWFNPFINPLCFNPFINPLYFDVGKTSPQRVYKQSQ